jgi:hypothetical protein
MKRITLILLVVALVFSVGVPVSLGAPEDFQMLTQDSSGMEVYRIQMRLRDLGYLNYRPTGMYRSMTQAAVVEFQKDNGLDSDGRLGPQTYDKLFSFEAKRKPLSAGIVPVSGPTRQPDAPSPGEAADWATVVNAAIPVGTTITVTDYNTGKSFSVKRTGGTGHADVETVDEAATNAFLECYGKSFTWEKRPVLVKVGEATYAASLLGHPDGADTLPDNKMEGHTCLYFTGSTSDVLGFVDKEHARNVLVAAGQL